MASMRRKGPRRMRRATGQEISGRERAAYIAALGMRPEPKGAPRSERYAATTGELYAWLYEKSPAKATRIRQKFENANRRWFARAR